VQREAVTSNSVNIHSPSFTIHYGQALLVLCITHPISIDGQILRQIHQVIASAGGLPTACLGLGFFL
jgi:hypothetical protein